MTYTYDASKLGDRGKDQMRFELGDTLIEGATETCALSDEEYNGILKELQPGKRSWMSAKLYALEAIMFKLSYQVDTKIDVLQYGFGKRAEQWQKMYSQLKKEILSVGGFPTMADSCAKKPPYFHTGMEENIRAQSDSISKFSRRN